MYVIRFLLVLVALLVVGVAGWLIYRNPQVVGLAPESAAPGEQAGGKTGGNRIPGLIGGGAVNVVTAPVQTDAGGETVMALGTAKAVRSVTLYPQVTGMVTEMLFQPGQPVEAGKPLVQLENDDQAVALDRARVTREQARLTLERSQALAKTKTISGVALSDAETAAQLADIEIRSAEIALRHRSVTAPFAGVTGLTDITIGDLVTPSTAITTLDDLATLRVNFEVPERWAGQIVMGQPIVGTVKGLPGKQFSGSITGIDNRVDETTRTLRLEAEIANHGGALKTGMAVTVTLRFDSDRQLAVPSLAVQWDRRGSFVWKDADGAARRTEVAIIRRQSGIVIVKGALQAGRQGGGGGRAAAARRRQARRGRRRSHDRGKRRFAGRAAGHQRSCRQHRRRSGKGGLTAMARQLEDARVKLAKATQGLSALCVRRPVLDDRLQPPHRRRRARRLPRRRDPRAAGHRPPGHHHPRHL